MSKSCSYCYFKDKCHQSEVCENYYPIDQQAEDDAIDEMIEKNRIAFRAEWFGYIEEDANKLMTHDANYKYCIEVR